MEDDTGIRYDTSTSTSARVTASCATTLVPPGATTRILPHQSAKDDCDFDPSHESPFIQRLHHRIQDEAIEASLRLCQVNDLHELFVTLPQKMKDAFAAQETLNLIQRLTEKVPQHEDAQTYFRWLCFYVREAKNLQVVVRQLQAELQHLHLLPSHEQCTARFCKALQEIEILKAELKSGSAGSVNADLVKHYLAEAKELCILKTQQLKSFTSTSASGSLSEAVNIEMLSELLQRRSEVADLTSQSRIRIAELNAELVMAKTTIDDLRDQLAASALAAASEFSHLKSTVDEQLQKLEQGERTAAAAMTEISYLRRTVDDQLEELEQGKRAYEELNMIVSNQRGPTLRSDNPAAGLGTKAPSFGPAGPRHQTQ